MYKLTMFTSQIYYSLWKNHKILWQAKFFQLVFSSQLCLVILSLNLMDRFSRHTLSDTPNTTSEVLMVSKIFKKNHMIMRLNLFYCPNSLSYSCPINKFIKKWNRNLKIFGKMWLHFACYFRTNFLFCHNAQRPMLFQKTILAINAGQVIFNLW